MADKEEEAYLDALLRSMSEPAQTNSPEEPITEIPITENSESDMHLIEEPVVEEQQALRGEEDLISEPEDLDMAMLGKMLSGEISPEEISTEEPINEESINEESVLEEPILEEPAPTVELSSDPNHVMTPEEIAALVAGSSAESEIVSDSEDTVNEATFEDGTSAEDLLKEISEEGLGNPSMDEQTIEEPASDELVLEEPTSDELTLEEPSLDELTLEEPPLDELTLEEPSLDELTLEEPEPGDAVETGDGTGDEAPENEASVEGGEDDLSIDDMIKALQGEMSDATGDDSLFGEMDGITTDENATDVADPLAQGESYGEEADILALDDGTGLDEEVNLDAENMSEEEMARVASMSEESENTEGSEDSETLELESEEKPKKEKKKFSLKNFFLKFADEDEEDQPVDMNEEMMKELYGDRDSLADANPEEEFDKDKKKKKEKKKKEPKPKKEKPAKPKKEKKEKPPKDPAMEAKVPFGRIFVGVLVAAALIAIVIFGSDFLYYRIRLTHAENYYAQKNYQAAYETLVGMELKEKDQELFEKVDLIVNVKQGLDAYNNYYELDMIPEALDALVSAVGRKNQVQEQIVAAGVSLEVDNYYLKILSTLDYYGISEETALDLYAARSYSYYYDELKAYGGVY